MAEQVNYERAYKKLEEQIEFMMEDTKRLLENNPPKLEFNKVRVERKDGYTSIVIDASGEKMMYACYLYQKKNNKELMKLPYQYSNTFIFQLPKGEYYVRVFVRSNYSNDKKIVDTVRFYA